MNTPLCLARVLMLLVCISAPLAPCLAQAPIEPSWNGKYLSYYVKELNNPEPLQRQIACEAIGSMGSTAAAAVPDLAKLLDSKDMTDRIAAALALAKIGEASKPALPQLQKMTASADPNEKRVAYLAMEAISPPATVVVVDFFSSAYVLSLLIALVAGSVVAFALWKRRAPKKKKDVPAKATETSAASNAPAGPVTGAQTASKAAESAAPAPPAAPATAANASQYRKRVSRQLPGMESYIQEQEGPDAIKRDLARAQDEFRRVCDKQQELAKYFNSEELNKDPERMRQLRLENDELALRHFRLEVRVKALEVKMLEMLVDHGGASDPALRSRTEATIKQKWEDLRTLCETPAKTSWKGEQWVSVATASHSPIEDLRAHLASFDVTIPPRSNVPAESSDSADAKEALMQAAADADKSGDDAASDNTGSQSTKETSDVIAADPPKPSE
jgi:hypothetical protein